MSEVNIELHYISPLHSFSHYTFQIAIFRTPENHEFQDVLILNVNASDKLKH